MLRRATHVDIPRSRATKASILSPMMGRTCFREWVSGAAEAAPVRTQQAGVQAAQSRAQGATHPCAKLASTLSACHPVIIYTCISKPEISPRRHLCLQTPLASLHCATRTFPRISEEPGTN